MWFLELAIHKAHVSHNEKLVKRGRKRISLYKFQYKVLQKLVPQPDLEEVEELLDLEGW